MCEKQAKEVLTRVGVGAKELLDAYGCEIYLLESDCRTLTPVVSIEPAYAEEFLAVQLDVETSLTGQGVTARQALVFNDPLTGGGGHQVPGTPVEVDERIIVAPFVVDDKVIGAMCLNRKGTRFSDEDLALAETFATYASIALKNAQAHRDLQDSESRFRRLALENERLYERAQRDAETRAVLLREVNHRVQNNLSAIIGLLHAERRHSGLKGQPGCQSIMEDLVGRVEGLARVHRLLSASEWAPLQLSDLVTHIIDSTLQSLPRDSEISVDVPPSPVRVTSDQAHNLGLVISELASNSVKYALQGRDAARICVRINVIEDDAKRTVALEFRDDGPGYPEEVLRLERYSVGFDLIQSIVDRNLGGELSLHTDGGAVTIIRFEAEAQPTASAEPSSAPPGRRAS